MERPVPSTLHRAEDPNPERDEEQPRQRAQQKSPPSARLQPAGDLHFGLFQVGEEFGRDLPRKHHREVLVVLALFDARSPQLTLDSPALDDGHFEDVVAAQLFSELGVRELDRRVVLPSHELKRKSRHENKEQPEGTGSGKPVPPRSVVGRTKWVLISHALLLHGNAAGVPPDAHKLAI